MVCFCESALWKDKHSTKSLAYATSIIKSFKYFLQCYQEVEENIRPLWKRKILGKKQKNSLFTKLNHLFLYQEFLLLKPVLSRYLFAKRVGIKVIYQGVLQLSKLLFDNNFSNNISLSQSLQTMLSMVFI